MKPNSYSIWFIYRCTTITNSIYLPFKTPPPLHTYVCKRWVMSDLAVIPQMDLSLALIMMANSHRFDDVAHIGIRLDTGNHQHTVCIISRLTLQTFLSRFPAQGVCGQRSVALSPYVECLHNWHYLFVKMSNIVIGLFADLSHHYIHHTKWMINCRKTFCVKFSIHISLPEMLSIWL